MRSNLHIPAAVLALTMSLVYACGTEQEGITDFAPDASADDAGGTKDGSVTPSLDSGDSGPSGSDGSTTDGPTDGSSGADGAADADGASPADAADGGLTIHGKLVDRLGKPFAFWKVLTGNSTTPVTTSADGTFTTTAVPPYDLTAVSGSGDTVFVVLGLTRPDPVLAVPSYVSAQVSGTFEGTMPAITTNQGAQVIFAPTDGNATNADFNLSFGPATTYTRSPEWQAAGDVTGTLHLFQYTEGADNPAATFFGHAALENQTLSANQTKTVNFPALTSVTTSTISGAMTFAPSWVKGGSLFAFLRLQGTTARLAVNQTVTVDPSFSMPVPQMTGAVYGISFRAYGPLSGEQSLVRKVIGLGGNANVAMPAAAQLTAPANAATNVDGAVEFSWTKGDGLSYWSAGPKGEAPSAAAPRVHVLGAVTKGKLPDVTALGSTIPSLKTYSWRVATFPTIATVDAFTASENVDWDCTPYGTRGSDEASCTSSAARDFVTK